MVSLTDLSIVTSEGTAGWTATTTSYPAFTGAGETEEEAKLNLVDQINANESADAVNEGDQEGSNDTDAAV